MSKLGGLLERRVRHDELDAIGPDAQPPEVLGRLDVRREEQRDDAAAHERGACSKCPPFTHVEMAAL